MIPMFYPYTFLENHFNILSEVYTKTSGLLPVYKKGNQYYIAPDNTVEIYFGSYFADGILLPKDIVKSMMVLKHILNNEKQIYKMYPIFTQHNKYGYRVVLDNTISGFITVTTSDSKIALYLSKRWFPNIKDILDILKQKKQKT